MASIRTFVAIEIPVDIRDQIANLQFDLKGLGGRITWVKPENMHLTLKFLGDTDENLIENISDKLAQVVVSHNQFEIKVRGIGAFPNFKKPKVFWIGTEDEKSALVELANKIDKQVSQFGYEREKRRFSAHLTIGRVRDHKGIEPVIEKLKKAENFYPGKFEVKALLFIKSELTRQGPIYTVLKKTKLNKEKKWLTKTLKNKKLLN